MSQVVLTGLRTNSLYHLGNYIGALLPLRRLIESRQDCQINVFVPDLHSFTTPIDFEGFYEQTATNLALFVACGLPLNNPKVRLYRQSYLPAHSELTWILSNFASFGDLSRMVEFKDKTAALGDQKVSVGLFSYPILMAADILLYDALWVPVGQDQRQHLEFTRKIASQFNQRFGQTFVVPASSAKQQEFFGREAPRIRSLKHPQNKMSKSVDDPSGTIGLFDSPKLVAQKISGAVTDNFGQIRADWEKQPGLTNLLTILAALKNQTVDQVVKDHQGSNYADLKAETNEVVTKLLQNIQAAYSQVDRAQLQAHLENSEAHLNKVGQAKLAKVQKAIGLRQ